MTARRGTRLAQVALLGSCLAACGGKPALAPVGRDDDQSAAARRSAPAVTYVSGHLVASVGERTIGPLFARRGAGADAAGLVAWITVAEGWGRRVLVVPVGPDGAPRGRAIAAANVPVDTTMLVVRPMRGPAPGFVVAWTSLTDRGESLWSLTVGDDGKPRGKPVELARTADDVVWIDVVATNLGAVVVWAEETRDGDANLVAAPLEADGKVRGSPARVARGVVGWNVVELPSGIGLSTVAAASSPKTKPGPHALLREARSGGALSFQRLDLDGHATGQPVVLTAKPIVSGDVEVVRDGPRLVFAWTDRSGEEPSITIAALADDDVVEPPRTLADARGGASLLRLVRGAAGLGVMFEAPARPRGANHRVHVARLEPGLTLAGPPLSIDVIGDGQPELAPTSSGFAVLATVPDCQPDTPACATARAVSTLLRTDEGAGVVQREPLDFKTDPAALGWGLSCDGDTCFALTASAGPPGSPSRVRAAAVRPRANARRAAPEAAPPPRDGPHVVDVIALAPGERVVDVATARFGEAKVVALLSTKDDAADGARSAGRATGMTLSTRIVDERGASSAPAVLSTTALHVGGVAIAGMDRPEDGGAIAWVAREGGDPGVHVARIDKRGRRTNHVKLTTTKSDVSDVTITWAGGGWIVAWVDGRNGNGEVYATKVSTDLSRIAREERITNAPGDASDLVALARGDAVWLAWADPRESPRDGLSDVYVSAVRKHDAKRALGEQRVLPTAAHSRTPHLTAGPDGVHLAWIEEAPMGSETPSASGYGAFWARLDESGKVLGKPARVPLAGEGAATSVAIDASPDAPCGPAAAGDPCGSASSIHGSSAPSTPVRAVVARSTPAGISLDAVDLSASTPRASALLALDGPPSLDVALVLEGDLLWFNDDGPRASDRRARRARIAWTP